MFTPEDTQGGSMKEREIQRAILDYLAAKHVLAFRMNSGAAVREYKGKTRKIIFGVPGMADILAFPILPHEYGSVLWIECKAEKGKQSELQKSFQAQVESEGHKYIVARSIEDVMAAF